MAGATAVGRARPSSSGGGKRAGGRYILGELLGRGGMAEVFAGYVMGDHGFQKPVAIKRLLPELAVDHVFVERLIEEAKLLVGMQHGNIVSVLDLARDGDDVFLVMEFVDGPSLRQLIKARGNRGISPAISTYVVQAACQGLQFAHTQKGGAIIHADISPSNLLLTTSGEVRVADFGIARREGGGQGIVEGKWAYMAPEQARGEALDPRADVFAMGVVLYELLTGAHPFGRQVTHEERDSQPMRVIPPRVVKPSVPHGLDAVCMKALAHEKRDRYSSMQKLMDAIVEERFANQYREGASDLASAIRECNPNSPAQAAGNPRTMITDRPVTIMTRSLLRELTPVRRPSSPSQNGGKGGQQPQQAQPQQPVLPPRASSPDPRGKRPSSAPSERPSQSAYSQYSQHSGADPRAQPAHPVERGSQSQYSQHAQSHHAPSQHTPSQPSNRRSAPPQRPSSAPSQQQPPDRPSSGPPMDDAQRAAQQVMLQMPPGLLSNGANIPNFKMPQLHIPEPNAMAAAMGGSRTVEPQVLDVVPSRWPSRILTLLLLVGLIALMYWRLGDNEEKPYEEPAKTPGDIIDQNEGSNEKAVVEGDDSSAGNPDEPPPEADDSSPIPAVVDPPVNDGSGDGSGAADPNNGSAGGVTPASPNSGSAAGSGSAAIDPTNLPPTDTTGKKVGKKEGTGKNEREPKPDNSNRDTKEQGAKQGGTGFLRVSMSPWGWVEVAGDRKEGLAAKFTLRPGRYKVRLIEASTRRSTYKTVDIEAGKTTNLSWIWGESE